MGLVKRNVAPPVPSTSPSAGEPGRMVKLTVEVPVELDIRLHGLARLLGFPKRVLAVKFLSAGLDRYKEDGRLREIAAELVGKAETAA